MKGTSVGAAVDTVPFAARGPFYCNGARGRGKPSPSPPPPPRAMNYNLSTLAPVAVSALVEW